MISILMATHNKAGFLDRTLAAYCLQTYKDFEIVIVDDGSSDNTRDIVEKYSKELNIHYIYFDKIGISKARKEVLKNAKGEYLIITDDDRIPCKDFVLVHKSLLDQNEKCVVLGKECLIMSDYNQNVKYSFIDEFKIYNLYPELLDESEKQMFSADDLIRDYDSVIEKYYLSDYTESRLLDMVDRYGDDLSNFHLAWSRAFGGNMSFNRTLCDKLPEYDDNYKGYGIEDIDFSYQLYLQGFRFIFSRQARNYHQEHPRRKTENSEMYRNFEYFCSKYDTLEVKLMKMEWDNLFSLEQANDFFDIVIKYGKSLKNELLTTLSKSI